MLERGERVGGMALLMKHKLQSACDPGEAPDLWIAPVGKAL